MSSPYSSLSSEPYSVRSATPPGGKFPVFWVLLAAVVGVAVGAGVGALVTGGEDVSPSTAAASASSVAPPPTPTASALPPTTTELAVAGNSDAVKSLEAKATSERTPAEWIALERARHTKDGERIAELKRKIELLPDFGRSKEAKKEILALARDSLHYIATQQMLASLEHEVGADLLFAIWSNAPKSTPAAKLAEALSYTPEVRKRTSKALSLVLELEAVEKCDAAVDVLTHVKDAGDRRTLTSMKRFNRKTGCGAAKRADCWACLRKSDVLRDASDAARKRKSPL